MTKWILYHNPKCSKSREALSLLQSRKLELQIIEYLKDSPTEEQILELIKILDGPISALVRVKEEEYQNLKFDTDSPSEIAKYLAKYPKLMERPIVIKGNRAIIARPIENLEKL